MSCWKQSGSYARSKRRRVKVGGKVQNQLRFIMIYFSLSYPLMHEWMSRAMHEWLVVEDLLEGEVRNGGHILSNG